MPYKDKNKQLAYQREWMRQRRATYFEGKVCTHCGSGGELELDHIDPFTKVSHNIWSWKESRRLEELAKCQVLCKPCHKAKTQKDGSRHKQVRNYYL